MLFLTWGTSGSNSSWNKWMFLLLRTFQTEPPFFQFWLLHSYICLSGWPGRLVEEAGFSGWSRASRYVRSIHRKYYETMWKPGKGKNPSYLSCWHTRTYTLIFGPKYFRNSISITIFSSLKLFSVFQLLSKLQLEWFQWFLSISEMLISL